MKRKVKSEWRRFKIVSQGAPWWYATIAANAEGIEVIESTVWDYPKAERLNRGLCRLGEPLAELSVTHSDPVDVAVIMKNRHRWAPPLDGSKGLRLLKVRPSSFIDGFSVQEIGGAA